MTPKPPSLLDPPGPPGTLLGPPAPPAPAEFRGFDDPVATRKAIYDDALRAATELEPIQRAAQ